MPGDVEGQVFVVEDRDYLRQVLVEVLNDAGYAAAGFASARAALEELPQRSPRLILLDLQMPGMDGCEFLRRLRADAAWSELPVLVVSGVPERLAASSDGRGVSVLAKPFDNDTLLAYVERMIGPAAPLPAGA